MKLDRGHAPPESPAKPAIRLVVRRLTPRHEHELVAFLRRLSAAGDDRFFHPHPFTAEAVAALAEPGRRDEYHLVLAGRAGPAIAYGMLRGWEEGYAVPSLGIAVDPAWRGQGVGRRLVAHLHAVARGRGATSVRLTVARDNAAAVALYQSFGYVLQPHAAEAWLGRLELAATAVPRAA